MIRWRVEGVVAVVVLSGDFSVDETEESSLEKRPEYRDFADALDWAMDWGVGGSRGLFDVGLGFPVLFLLDFVIVRSVVLFLWYVGGARLARRCRFPRVCSTWAVEKKNATMTMGVLDRSSPMERW